MHKKLVLVRHGQSQWNKENRFTGWADVPLSPLGVEEAMAAGKLLKEKGFRFGEAHTSYLKRAIKTCWLVLEEMDQMHIPVHTDWRLNEKHYGALQGLNKAETAEKYGEDQVKRWRRGFAVAPPPLEAGDERSPLTDPRYSDIDPQLVPLTESLKDTIERLMPCWENEICASLRRHDQVMVAAHGNSLRGLVMHLKNLTEEEILEVNIPTGIPYVFELDQDLKRVNDYYLADEADLARRMAEVAAQGKAK